MIGFLSQLARPDLPPNDLKMAYYPIIFNFLENIFQDMFYH